MSTAIAQAPHIEAISTLQIVFQNTLQAPRMPYRPTEHRELIDCLAEHESQWYAKAVGQAGEKGILQFMPSTFLYYCVERFAFRDDIWDTEIQILCADYMIQRDWSNRFQWTTLKFCE